MTFKILSAHGFSRGLAQLALTGNSSRNNGQPRIRMISAYSTRNLGDAAIMRAIARLSPLGHAGVARLDAHAINIPGIRFTDSHSNDGVRVSVGGDIFNNHRPRLVTRNFLAKVAELNQNPKRTIVFGQTIPSSCSGMSLALLAHTLRRLPAVVVRDEESHALLRARGVKTELSWDAAFMTRYDAAAVVRSQAIFDAANMDPQKAALVSVRPFGRMYPVEPMAFERRLQTLCTSLSGRGHQIGLLIQSDVNACDEDRTIAARIAASDARIRIVDCLADTEDPDPVATLTAVLAMANIVVGVRYHTTILRLATGRQPYNFYYSRKGGDLTTRLGLAGSTVDGVADSNLIKKIEATSSASFDTRPIAQHIQQHFDAAVRAAQL